MNKQITINQLPARTWRWIKGNEVQLAWGEEVPFSLTAQDKLAIIRPGCGAYSVGEVSYSAQPNETVTVLQLIDSDHDTPTGLRLHTHLEVGAQATLQLIQVFSSPKHHKVVSRVTATCQEEGTVELYQVMAGHGDLYCDTAIELLGDKSHYTMGTGYVAEDQVLDMNLIVQHKGCDTTSEIVLEGVIKEKGYKVFRGTIDLQHGASGADGSEHEYVMLLGDEFKNLTIPVILCNQEDVHGSHGGSISELEESLLFYLNTRGIDRKCAEDMISSAKLERIINRIEDDELKDKIYETLGDVLDYV